MFKENIKKIPVFDLFHQTAIIKELSEGKSISILTERINKYVLETCKILIMDKGYGLKCMDVFLGASCFEGFPGNRH